MMNKNKNNFSNRKFEKKKKSEYKKMQREFEILSEVRSQSGGTSLITYYLEGNTSS